MTHTLIADDYKLVRSGLLENPDWEAVEDAGGASAVVSRQAEMLPDPAAALLPTGAGAPSRSWLQSLCSRLAQWLRDCAERYAAAAAFENLSRLSDTQLKHRGLSRDILARDLSVR